MSVRPTTTGGARPEAKSGSPYRFGRYTLLTKLAQGGMGEVFVALLSGAAGFEKLVVIKRILPHLAEDPRFVSMFLAEARLTASLAHPNICQVFELGEIDGDYYLAMEYLEGVALSRLFKKRVHRGLDLRFAAAVACQALEGLQFAHRYRQPGGGLVGVIHRDMSPSNVFVTSAGLVKVLDFGVAKVSHNARTTVTGLKGKYPYMAPEQIRGLEVDGRSDLFSVGVVLFEAITGEPLFHRDTDFETLQAIVNNDRPRVSDYRRDVPLAVEEVIERALRPRREERFASAREMAEALTRALAPLGGPATTGELADVIRRDCAAELESERSRIDRAAEYLKELTGRCAELPELSSRRARPVVGAEPEGLPAHGVAGALAAPLAAPMPLGGPSPSAPLHPVGSGPEAALAGSTVERMAARRRRYLVVALALCAAIGVSAGIAASSGGGSAEEAASEAATEPATAAATETAAAAESAGATETAAAAESATETAAAAESAGATETAATETAAATAAETDAKAGDEEPASASEDASRGSKRRPAARRGRERRGERGSRPAAQPARPAGPGYFSIDTMPYSQVYIDGELAGITPLVRVPLQPGKHSVRVVTQAGTQRRLTIKVQSGKTVTRRLSIEE